MYILLSKMFLIVMALCTLSFSFCYQPEWQLRPFIKAFTISWDKRKHIIWKKEWFCRVVLTFTNCAALLVAGTQFIPLPWWCIGIVWNSFDTVPKETYMMPKQWDHLVSNLLKVVSGCGVDVVRHLFLVSRWFNLTTGQTGHISEGLLAMLKVTDKMFLKSIFLPMPQVHRCLLNYSFFQHFDPWWSHFRGNSVFLKKD